MLRQGLTEDYALELLKAADEVTIGQLKEFHQKHIAGKPIAFMIVGDKDAVRLSTSAQEVDIKTVLHL